MPVSSKKILLIGYGNPGRGDDGLGPALAERLLQKDLPGLVVDIDYQLTVEHAHDVINFDLVIFVDASIDCNAPFTFKEIDPTKVSGFYSHSVSPEVVLTLAKDLFAVEPVAYLLGIRGYCFTEIVEQLSKKAANNLALANKFIIAWIAEYLSQPKQN